MSSCSRSPSHWLYHCTTYTDQINNKPTWQSHNNHRIVTSWRWTTYGKHKNTSTKATNTSRQNIWKIIWKLMIHIHENSHHHRLKLEIWSRAQHEAARRPKSFRNAVMRCLSYGLAEQKLLHINNFQPLISVSQSINVIWSMQHGPPAASTAPLLLQFYNKCFTICDIL